MLAEIACSVTKAIVKLCVLLTSVIAWDCSFQVYDYVMGIHDPVLLTY